MGHPNLALTEPENSPGHLPVTDADTTAMSYILRTPKTSTCEVQRVILHPPLCQGCGSSSGPFLRRQPQHGKHPMSSQPQVSALHPSASPRGVMSAACPEQQRRVFGWHLPTGHLPSPSGQFPTYFQVPAGSLTQDSRASTTFPTLSCQRRTFGVNAVGGSWQGPLGLDYFVCN